MTTNPTPSPASELTATSSRSELWAEIQALRSTIRVMARGEIVPIPAPTTAAVGDETAVGDLIQKRIGKYTRDLDRHVAPSQPDGICRCDKCRDAHGILKELEYIAMAWRFESARALAATPGAVQGREEIARKIAIDMADCLSVTQDHFVTVLKRRNVLSTLPHPVAGEIDPSKLSDGELILCLEEMRKRDLAINLKV